MGETFSAVLAIIWGAWVTNPRVDTFASAPSVYQTMLWVCPSELAWGLMVLIGGIVQLYAVWSGRHRIRMVATFAGAMTWLLLALMFAVGDLRSTGCAVFTLIFLASARTYLKLGREV